MRHAHYLLAERHAEELLAHSLRRDARYARVYLVEDHRPDGVVFRKDILHRKHDAAQLAAGGDAAYAA